MKRDWGRLAKLRMSCNFNSTLRTWRGKHREGILGRGDNTSKARGGRDPGHNEVACATGGQVAGGHGEGEKEEHSPRGRQESDWKLGNLHWQVRARVCKPQGAQLGHSCPRNAAVPLALAGSRAVTGRLGGSLT